MKGIQLTTYTPNTPIHGGKIRSKALLEIFAATFGPDISAINLYIGHRASELKALYRDTNEIDDLLTFDYLATHSIQDFMAADYLLVEQPWAWPIATKLKREKPGTICIYSSQNIESILKEHILWEVDSEVRDPIIERIQKLEVEAAQEADLVIACSYSDQQWFIAQGINPAKIVFIPNCTSADQFAGQLTPMSKKGNYFVLAASAYRPTIESFMQLFSMANYFLPPQMELKLIGGIADYLATKMGSRNATALNGGINLVGVVDDKTLHSYLAGALGIILPVKFGGGTNLKTAEALYYNKYIIGTKEALRGFEKYLDDPKIYIVRDSQDVMKAVWQIYNAVEQDSSLSDKRSHRAELTWSYWREEGPKVIREALSL